MAHPDRPRLAATLGQPALARLLATLRRRLERGRPLTGRLILPSPTLPERAACDALLGRKPSSGTSLAIDLDALATALVRAGLAPSLTAAVETLTGPILNRAASAAQLRAAWELVWQNAGARHELGRHPRLAPWLADLRHSGILRRLADDDPARADACLKDLARLVAALPHLPEPLPSLATRVFGNAHALDPGPPLATLAVRAAARLAALPFEDTAEGRRAAWAGVGVLCDELSTPVIAFRLVSRLPTPLGRLLRTAADDAEPLHLSLRLLLRHPLVHDPSLRGQEIFICENPTIVALAATRLAHRCRPLVCVNGQFATPALVLLRQLRDAGARLHYHGDFDPAGLAIARRAMKEAGALPWRFGAGDYRAADKGIPFQADPGPTPWSPELADELRATRRAVHEEAVFDSLALDLDLDAPAAP